MRTIAPLALVVMLALAACSAAATPSPPGGASPVASAARTAAPSVAPSPAISAAADSPTAEESQLLAGVRLDLQGACAPLRTEQPQGAVAAIECRPKDADVAGRAVLYLFDGQQALMDTYAAQLDAHGIVRFTNGGRCEPDRASEGGYVPGDGHGIIVNERGACYRDENGMAHYIATLPPFVLVAVDGTIGDISAVERFAWLGNQDQPGGPTLWNAGGPMSPEK